MCQVATCILSAVSLFLSIIAAFSCQFVAGHTNARNWVGGTWRGAGFVGYSTYSRDYHTFCTGYSSSFKDVWFDSAWKAGMAMAIIAFAFGLFATIGSFLFLCDRNIAKKVYTCLPCLFLFTGICQGLSLVALSSELLNWHDIEQYPGLTVDLGIGPGAGCAIAATVLWLGCVCTSIAHGKEAADDEVEETGPAGAEEPLLAEDADAI